MRKEEIKIVLKEEWRSIKGQTWEEATAEARNKHDKHTIKSTKINSLRSRNLNDIPVSD